MQPVEAGRVQSAINVTPLVDVVLVLLIIFMVIAPQLASGPEMRLPVTEGPPPKPDDGRQILVALENNGSIWIDREQVAVEAFPQQLQAAAVEHEDWKVVIKGDARLTFGQVKQAMLAVEAAGFDDVGLIAMRRDEAEQSGMLPAED